MKKTIKKCKHILKTSESYLEWLEAALNLDYLEKKEAWKNKKESKYYDYKLIEKRLEYFRTCLSEKNIKGLTYALREDLHHNLNNLGNYNLYSKTYVGTKKLIEEYVNEVSSILEYLCDNEFDDLPFPLKIQFFEETAHSFGRSALLLSGGASFGLYHVGVIKALWEHGLLPRVISGSSMGAVVAAAAGIYEDINKMFDPSNLYMTMLERMPIIDMIKQRALLKSSQIEYFLRENLGEFTFEEAFRKTGMIINITASPATENRTPVLFNYINFPHVLVWSAVLASCSIPGLFPPSVIMMKDYRGNAIPYMESLKWIDGTLTSDIPMKRLAELYNVNHFIVSQTNPHIAPFMSENKNQVFDSIQSVIKSETSYIASKFMKAISMAIPEKRAKLLADDISQVLSQPYSGDITIIMKLPAKQYFYLLTNPTLETYKQFVLGGEKATWPKMTTIYTQTKIGQTLEACVLKLERRRRKYYAGSIKTI
ncbi:MAG: DUF3336 domain-containing protein [Desulfobacterales bacterium]|nr:DUF3336 domain-containing protein [Desulfobacterales bacterium]